MKMENIDIEEIVSTISAYISEHEWEVISAILCLFYLLLFQFLSILFEDDESSAYDNSCNSSPTSMPGNIVLDSLDRDKDFTATCTAFTAAATTTANDDKRNRVEKCIRFPKEASVYSDIDEKKDTGTEIDADFEFQEFMDRFKRQGFWLQYIKAGKKEKQERCLVLNSDNKICLYKSKERGSGSSEMKGLPSHRPYVVFPLNELVSCFQIVTADKKPGIILELRCKTYQFSSLFPVDINFLEKGLTMLINTYRMNQYNNLSRSCSDEPDLLEPTDDQWEAASLSSISNQSNVHYVKYSRKNKWSKYF